MKLYNIIIKTSDQAIKKQKQNGLMTSGHNGSYFHSETPIRNTGHWLITFLKTYEITNNKKYLEAANKCLEYLITTKSKYNYCHRIFKGKDNCNGLIGPAWTMEALLIAFKKLNRKDLSDLTSDIFLLHNFDEKLGLWHRREINGKILPIDWTFNHQLWFAAVGSMLDKDLYSEIHNQIQKFIQKIPVNFDIYKNGLIWHPVAKIPFDIKNYKRLLGKIKLLILDRKKTIHKAIGYHQFNLYAFAILKENYPDLSFWQSKKFQKSLEFIESKEYEEGLINNEFGFDYNVAGIEIAYALKVFKKNSEEKQKYWLEKQFQRNYDFENNMLCKNTDDLETLAARIYEATRLDDLELNLISEKPFVSVIVPVYNDSKRIKLCLECLTRQSYGKESYEIIIVDNNSSDDTMDMVKKYPVKLLSEKKFQSSYAARNKGLKESQGEIIAFTDSDCQPEKKWLENGVRAMLSEKVDLVAGKVSFLFSNENDPFEICDSIEHMQQENYVKNGSGATANLFVKKKVFDGIGFFPNNVKSGGDGSWTKNATTGGYKLIYCQNAIVGHPTRRKKEILEKKIRIGYGNISALINKKRNPIKIIFSIILGLLPPIRINIQKIKVEKTPGLLLKIYYAKWLGHIYYNFGKLLYLKDNIFSKNKK